MLRVECAVRTHVRWLLLLLLFDRGFLLFHFLVLDGELNLQRFVVGDSLFRVHEVGVEKQLWYQVVRGHMRSEEAHRRSFCLSTSNRGRIILSCC